MTSIRQKGTISSNSTKNLTEKKIDVVIVSVNYNDYLSVTLEHNSKIFDNITVVTSNEDGICKKICDKYGAKCLQTDEMYSNENKFNKGKAINFGIKSIENPEFILLLDADIIVKEKIKTSELETGILYTSGRIIIESYNRYLDWIKDENIKTRTESDRGLGFFHLFDIKSKQINIESVYKEDFPNADGSDLYFRSLFSRRVTINNKIVHLGAAYKNWKGRKSEDFIPMSKVYGLLDVKADESIIEEKVNKNKTFTICSYYFNFRDDVRQKDNFIKFLEQFKGYYDKMIVGVVDYEDIDFDIPCEKIVIKGDKNKKIWSKEIIINQIIDKIDTDYLLWIDGDLIYENLDWLNSIDDWSGDSDFIQLFETINYLDESGNTQESHKSIISSGRNDIDQLLRKGYKPGGAWMGKTSILKEKKLFQKMYVGGGDTIFIYGLFRTGNGWTLNRIKESNLDIHKDALKWINNFGKYKFGYLNEKVNHLYHGELKDRNYDNRYKSLKYKEFDYDFCVIVTTYNRPDMLEDLIKDINLKSSDYRILITIFDDGSELDYSFIDKYDIKYIKYNNNHGKLRYWSLINDTFKYCRNISSKKYIYLPDDIRLKEDFFKESLRIFDKILDDDKICLNLLMDENRRGSINWTGFSPIRYDEYYKTQWNDLCFISSYSFFECLKFEILPIDKSRWDKNKELGSGVGHQMSIRLLNEGKNMYHVYTSLVTHDDHESKMNYENRKKIKLIAI